ncbi:MAG: hypothetical protein GQ529_06330, partial [Methyloprofundus sp.]|nr:hypothetical protein [Methyloprofundus sp.]
DVIFTASIGPDTTPPAVVSTSPNTGATAVDPATGVTGTFGEQMDPATINTSTFELRGPAPDNTLIPATVSYDPGTFTATLIPSAVLTVSTAYTATVKGGTIDPRVKDVAGNALAADSTWTFTTAAPDTTPPELITQSPAAGATGIATNTTLTATFSEALDAATIASSTFEIRGPAPDNVLIPATVSYDSITFIATLTPSAVLTVSTAYTATVKGGTIDPRVKDVAGNALVADVTWTFTTVATDTIPGLVASYDFEEGSGLNVEDSSGNGNAGTISGATWDTSGHSGGALSFDGVNDWVTIADANILDLTNGMTLDAWVYPTVLSDWRTVIMKEIPNGLAYTLYAHDKAPRTAGYINVGDRDIVARGNQGALPLNTWTRLTLTYDGAIIRLYENGIEVGIKAVSGDLVTSSEPLRIGGNAPWGEYFGGLIDEVRIYNRALSAAEL